MSARTADVVCLVLMLAFLVGIPLAIFMQGTGS